MRKLIFAIFLLCSFLGRGQDFADWKAKFEGAWYSASSSSTWANYNSTMNYAESTGEDQEHYYAAWGIEGVIAAWRATGDLDYLDDAIIITNEIISNAVPVFGGSYLGWPATKTGSVNPNGQPLWESYYWRHIATMLRVMDQSPILLATSNGDLPGTTYQDSFDTILEFLETNIWEKWTTSGNQNDVYRIRTHMASHWARIGMELFLVTGTQEYKDVFENISWKGFPGNTSYPGANLRNNLVVSGSGYVWDQNWENTSIQDTDHGADIINFLVEAASVEQYWTEADIDRMVYQFDSVIWNNDDPVQWYQYVDGSGSATGGTPSLHEWLALGRYSQDLQDRVEAAYWLPNPSFPLYSPTGNHAMGPGVILLNMTELAGTTVYPEDAPDPDPQPQPGTGKGININILLSQD